MLTLPNLFLLGAPKCGTTALYTYLGTHPQVFFPDDKEPHFFAEDFPTHRTCKTMVEYKQLYSSVDSQSIIGDASVLSLYSELAISQILKHSPEAKFLVAVRNPVDLVISLHRQFVLSGRDRELSFERAWNRELCSDIQSGLLYYPRYGHFAFYLNKLLDIVDQSRIRIVFLEDLQTDPLEVYLELLSFLELPDDLRRDFPRVNEGREHRYPKISHFVLSQPWLVSFLKTIKIAGLLRNWGSTSAVSTPLPKSFRSELEGYFLEDIQWLAEKTDRDLTHWFSSHLVGEKIFIDSVNYESQPRPHTEG